MTANNLREQLESGILDARLKEIYLTEDPAAERKPDGRFVLLRG